MCKKLWLILQELLLERAVTKGVCSIVTMEIPVLLEGQVVRAILVIRFVRYLLVVLVVQDFLLNLDCHHLPESTSRKCFQNLCGLAPSRLQSY